MLAQAILAQAIVAQTVVAQAIDAGHHVVELKELRLDAVEPFCFKPCGLKLFVLKPFVHKP